MIRAPLFPFSCSPGSFHSSPVVKILGFPRGLVRSCWGYRTIPLLHPLSSRFLSLSPRFPLFSSTADSSTARRDAAPADSTLENSSYCLTPSFEATGQDSNQRRAAVSTAVGPNMPLRVYFFRRSKLFFGISDFLWMPRTISKREQPFPCFGIRRSFYRRIWSSKWFSRERQSRKQISVLFHCEYSFSS